MKKISFAVFPAIFVSSILSSTLSSTLEAAQITSTEGLDGIVSSIEHNVSNTAKTAKEMNQHIRTLLEKYKKAYGAYNDLLKAFRDLKDKEQKLTATYQQKEKELEELKALSKVARYNLSEDDANVFKSDLSFLFKQDRTFYEEGKIPELIATITQKTRGQQELITQIKQKLIALQDYVEKIFTKKKLVTPGVSQPSSAAGSSTSSNDHAIKKNAQKIDHKEKKIGSKVKKNGNFTKN